MTRGWRGEVYRRVEVGNLNYMTGIIKREGGSEERSHPRLTPPGLRFCAQEIEACRRMGEGDVGGVYPRRRLVSQCSVLRLGSPCPFVIRQFPS